MYLFTNDSKSYREILTIFGGKVDKGRRKRFDFVGDSDPCLDAGIY